MKNFEQGKGVQNVLEEGYKLIGNPMVIVGMQYNLLASTENKVDDDDLWNELLTYGKFSHDTVNFLNTEKFVEDVANTDVIAVLKSNKIKYDRICGKLFDKEGLQIGNITVVGCYKDFESADFENIEKLCENISVEIQKSQFYIDINSLLQETFIGHTIERKKIDKSFSEAMMNDIYKGLKTNLYVVVVDITQYERTVTQLSYIRDLLEHLEPRFKYYIYLNNIIIILSTDKIIINKSKYLIYLEDFFVKNKIYCGISSSFQNLTELPIYYKQALKALNYGLDCGNNEMIFKYDDFRLDYFFNFLKNDIDLDIVCNPIVPIIKEYDNINQTSYLNFIYNYLLFGRNINMTCQKLKISEDKLNLLLEKIQELFEIDWNNGNLLCNIFISTKILKKEI